MTRLPVLLAALLLSACTTADQLAAPVKPTGPAPASAMEVQLLGINDFHGNLETPTAPVTVVGAGGAKQEGRFGGAAALAATLERLRAEGRPSVTVAAGDLIGATPLVSAYFLDEPTIKALSLMKLDVAAVGNHEFDKGSAELLRMQNGGCEKHGSREPCRLEPFAGAGFQYLGANVIKADGTTLLPATAIKQVGAVKIGFVGMTLKETATLVTPAGVRGLAFADEAATANAWAKWLKASGAHSVVLLIHQGGRVPETYKLGSCEGLSGDILPILAKLDDTIDAVVSGHTHNSYACHVPVRGRNVMLTSAGKNGYLVTDIRLTFDPNTRKLIGTSAVNVPVTGTGSPEVSALVDRYQRASREAANRVVGRLSGPAMRSETDDESPAARLIADAQLAATRSPDRGGAQLAFINATGVRTNLIPGEGGAITYEQIFALQPFGNGLVVKTLTGTQLLELLEQQFRTGADGKAKTMLLVPSSNLRFSYDLTFREGQRLRDVRLDGRPIRRDATYLVAVNNFLASGGDGFTLLSQGRDPFDAGLDLDALEAWLKTNPKVPADQRTTDRTPKT
ncbi:bifunctional metallophosphatase/5'-nucleotidase [Sphingomonas sp. GCM10030256]|uniref:bifunctional metallophosphatase/5'-nucleotidase n=1 Tax=Sphingomonas sp. GCM10030256 TaxID=3273427 RepID=UPI00361F3DBC